MAEQIALCPGTYPWKLVAGLFETSQARCWARAPSRGLSQGAFSKNKETKQIVVGDCGLW